MPDFHPDLDLVTEYTAGTLPLAHAACIHVHISQCQRCHQLAGQLADLGATLFEQLECAAVGDQRLNALLTRLDEPVPLEYVRHSDHPQDTPAILQRLMVGDFTDLHWRNFGSSTRVSYLQTGDRDHEFALYHFKAGGRIPEHTHRGCEMTQVLQGGFSDEGTNYHRGDFVFRDSGDTHSPRALPSEDCICLVVLDAPLKFTGWKFRWMNPFLKFRAA
jgi:putative transcriptional regulator